MWIGPRIVAYPWDNVLMRTRGLFLCSVALLFCACTVSAQAVSGGAVVAGTGSGNAAQSSSQTSNSPDGSKAPGDKSSGPKCVDGETYTIHMPGCKIDGTPPSNPKGTNSCPIKVVMDNGGNPLTDKADSVKSGNSVTCADAGGKNIPMTGADAGQRYFENIQKYMDAQEQINKLQGYGSGNSQALDEAYAARNEALRNIQADANNSSVPEDVRKNLQMLADARDQNSPDGSGGSDEARKKNDSLLIATAQLKDAMGLKAISMDGSKQISNEQLVREFIASSQVSGSRATFEQQTQSLGNDSAPKSFNTGCSVCDSALNWGAKAYNSMKETVSSAWNSAKETVSSTWNSAKETVSSAWNSVTETASAAIEKVSNAVSLSSGSNESPANNSSDSAAGSQKPSESNGYFDTGSGDSCYSRLVWGKSCFSSMSECEASAGWYNSNCFSKTRVQAAEASQNGTSNVSTVQQPGDYQKLRAQAQAQIRQLEEEKRKYDQGPSLSWSGCWIAESCANKSSQTQDKINEIRSHFAKIDPNNIAPTTIAALRRQESNGAGEWLAGVRYRTSSNYTDQLSILGKVMAAPGLMFDSMVDSAATSIGYGRPEHEIADSLCPSCAQERTNEATIATMQASMPSSIGTKVLGEGVKTIAGGASDAAPRSTVEAPIARSEPLPSQGPNPSRTGVPEIASGLSREATPISETSRAPLAQSESAPTGGTQRILGEPGSGVVQPNEVSNAGNGRASAAAEVPAANASAIREIPSGSVLSDTKFSSSPPPRDAVQVGFAGSAPDAPKAYVSAVDYAKIEQAVKEGKPVPQITVYTDAPRGATVDGVSGYVAEHARTSVPSITPTPASSWTENVRGAYTSSVETMQNAVSKAKESLGFKTETLRSEPSVQVSVDAQTGKVVGMKANGVEVAADWNKMNMTAEDVARAVYSDQAPIAKNVADIHPQSSIAAETGATPKTSIVSQQTAPSAPRTAQGGNFMPLGGGDLGGPLRRMDMGWASMPEGRGGGGAARAVDPMETIAADARKLVEPQIAAARAEAEAARQPAAEAYGLTGGNLRPYGVIEELEGKGLASRGNHPGEMYQNEDWGGVVKARSSDGSYGEFKVVADGMGGGRPMPIMVKKGGEWVPYIDPQTGKQAYEIVKGNAGYVSDTLGTEVARSLMNLKNGAITPESFHEAVVNGIKRADDVIQKHTSQFKNGFFLESKDVPGGQIWIDKEVGGSTLSVGGYMRTADGELVNVTATLGDSPVFLVRDGIASRLTVDDNALAAFYKSDADRIAAQSLIDHFDPNKMSFQTLGERLGFSRDVAAQEAEKIWNGRYGISKSFSVEGDSYKSVVVRKSEAREGDRVVVGSDGWSDNLTPRQTADALGRHADDSAAAKQLVSDALDVSRSGAGRAKPDDITAGVVTVRDESVRASAAPRAEYRDVQAINERVYAASPELQYLAEAGSPAAKARYAGMTEAERRAQSLQIAADVEKQSGVKIVATEKGPRGWEVDQGNVGRLDENGITNGGNPVIYIHSELLADPARFAQELAHEAGAERMIRVYGSRDAWPKININGEETVLWANQQFDLLMRDKEYALSGGADIAGNTARTSSQTEPVSVGATRAGAERFAGDPRAAAKELSQPKQSPYSPNELKIIIGDSVPSALYKNDLKRLAGESKAEQQLYLEGLARYAESPAGIAVQASAREAAAQNAARTAGADARLRNLFKEADTSARSPSIVRDAPGQMRTNIDYNLSVAKENIGRMTDSVRKVAGGIGRSIADATVSAGVAAKNAVNKVGDALAGLKERVLSVQASPEAPRATRSDAGASASRSANADTAASKAKTSTSRASDSASPASGGQQSSQKQASARTTQPEQVASPRSQTQNSAAENPARSRSPETAESQPATATQEKTSNIYESNGQLFFEEEGIVVDAQSGIRTKETASMPVYVQLDKEGKPASLIIRGPVFDSSMQQIGSTRKFLTPFVDETSGAIYVERGMKNANDLDRPWMTLPESRPATLDDLLSMTSSSVWRLEDGRAIAVARPASAEEASAMRAHESATSPGAAPAEESAAPRSGTSQTRVKEESVSGQGTVAPSGTSLVPTEKTNLPSRIDTPLASRMEEALRTTGKFFVGVGAAIFGDSIYYIVGDAWKPAPTATTGGAPSASQGFVQGSVAPGGSVSATPASGSGGGSGSGASPNANGGTGSSKPIPVADEKKSADAQPKQTTQSGTKSVSPDSTVGARTATLPSAPVTPVTTQTNNAPVSNVSPATQQQPAVQQPSTAARNTAAQTPASSNAVTASPKTVLATPVASTQFPQAKTPTPAPKIDIVANPPIVENGQPAYVSWSARWSIGTPAGIDCAAITDRGILLGQHMHAQDSIQTLPLSQTTKIIVGCKATGGLLGTAKTTVGVRGTQGVSTASYLPTTDSYSSAGAQLIAALTGSNPAQSASAACESASVDYFACLSARILIVNRI